MTLEIVMRLPAMASAGFRGGRAAGAAANTRSALVAERSGVSFAPLRGGRRVDRRRHVLRKLSAGDGCAWLNAREEPPLQHIG